MQKRLLGRLVIGGVAVLCVASNVRAEDKTALQWDGNAASNTGAAVPVPTPSPTNPEAERPTALATADVPASERYRPLIDSISKRHGVDPNLVDAMIKTESNYNPWAVSAKGAMGLMQLIPETGRRFGVSNFFDPQQNIEGGVRYMRYLLGMFDGNVDLSLAAYNAGENLVAKIQKIPPYPETRNYVKKIRADYAKPKPGKLAVASNLRNTPAAQPVPRTDSKPVAVVSGGSSVKADETIAGKVAEVPVPPIEKWMDERGVRHFSNIEPLK